MEHKHVMQIVAAILTQPKVVNPKVSPETLVETYTEVLTALLKADPLVTAYRNAENAR